MKGVHWEGGGYAVVGVVGCCQGGWQGGLWARVVRETEAQRQPGADKVCGVGVGVCMWGVGVVKAGVQGMWPVEFMGLGGHQGLYTACLRAWAVCVVFPHAVVGQIALRAESQPPTAQGGRGSGTRGVWVGRQAGGCGGSMRGGVVALGQGCPGDRRGTCDTASVC